MGEAKYTAVPMAEQPFKENNSFYYSAIGDDICVTVSRRVMSIDHQRALLRTLLQDSRVCPGQREIPIEKREAVAAAIDQWCGWGT